MSNAAQEGAKEGAGRSKGQEYEERRAKEKAVSMARRSWLFPLLAIPIALIGLVVPFVGLINLLVLVCSISALIRAYAYASRKGWDGLTFHLVLGTILNIPIIAFFVLLLVGVFAMLVK